MYDETIKSLRQCAEGSCAGCKNDLVQIGCRGLLQREAADAIEELQQIAGHYEEAAKDYFKDACYYRERVPHWTPVGEQLIHSGWYLVACNEWGGSAVRKAIYDEATRKWLEFPCGGPKNITKFVTHYMPLPQPPKEKPTCEDCQRECQMMGLDMEACASYEPPKEKR